MIDVEKEAINYIMNLKETIGDSIILFDEGITINAGKIMYNNLQIILALVQKQEIELKKKDKVIEQLNATLDEEM